VIEHVFEKIMEKVLTNDMQYGFKPAKGTTHVVFTFRQKQEKYGDKGIKLYFVFLSLKRFSVEYLESLLDGL